ncbi:MAG: DUF4856 domain-containing protein [Crocinitomicaceae bacterium]|nr:DUF4856 domain-containing protein [Crocinitomicaceae bacterium]MBK8925146.1 DUF4856 domain-containing protein [Crocinitomicaceae bacterium]
MNRTLVILGFSTMALLSCKKEGCTDSTALNYNEEAKKDDGSCEYFQLTVPTTYSFTDGTNNTVSYGGQTERLDQLTEMTTYMKTGTTGVLTYQALTDMFANTGGNGGGNFSFTSTKKLMDKCLAADTSLFIDYMDSLAIASQDYASTATDGQAGTLTSGTSTYLFAANGIEYTQLIEKGLMGAVFMYQSTQVYFGSGKMNVDNTTPVDAGAGEYYTEMEHHWDEAFGYFGVPVDFPTNTSGIRFWGKYCNSRNGDLGCNAVMMNGFLRGRAAISQDALDIRDEEILNIRKMWEKISARQALQYLEDAKSNFGVDNALFLHELSEAYAFIMCLKYVPLETRVITYTEIETLLDTHIGADFWQVTQADLTNAINSLNSIYGF